MNKIGNIFLQTSFLLLGIIFFPTFLASTLFVFKISISEYTFIISVLLLLVLYWKIFYNKNSKKTFYIPIIVSLFVTLFTFLLCSYIGDLSWDGWAYHLPAIIELKDGWNPIYTHDEAIGIWSLHYPKFIWIYSATLYKMIGNFSIGTSFNFLLTFSFFFLLLDFFTKKGKNIFFSIIFSLIISFNVIVIGQFFSYYNDGVLGNCIWALLLLFYAISKKIYKLENNYVILLLITFYASILVNIKFTGALFAFLIIAIYYCYLLWNKQLRQKNFIIISIVTIGVGVLVVSCTTYLPNLIYHKNIGYPIMGENKIDIITDLTPNMFKNENKFKSFFKSITYDVHYDTYQYNPFFIIEKDALKKTPATDCRIGGFGPFYQSIILATLLFYIFLLSSNFKLIKEFKKTFLSYKEEIIMILVIVLFTIITPATWWARYVPYLYVLPIILILMVHKKWKKYCFENLIVHFIIFIYLLSIPIYFGIRFNTRFNETKNLNNIINFIKIQSKDVPVSIESYDLSNLWYKKIVREEIFKLNNIEYVERELGKCVPTNSYVDLGISIVNCEGSGE